MEHFGICGGRLNRQITTATRVFYLVVADFRLRRGGRRVIFHYLERQVVQGIDPLNLLPVDCGRKTGKGGNSTTFCGMSKDAGMPGLGHYIKHPPCSCAMPSFSCACITQRAARSGKLQGTSFAATTYSMLQTPRTWNLGLSFPSYSDSKS